MIHLLSLKKANPAWANTANHPIVTAQAAAPTGNVGVHP
jgi:hypothetical protein